MRKLVLIVAACVLFAVPAAAQDVVPIPIAQLVGSVTPPGPENRHPILQLGLTLNRESGPVARRVTWTLPRGVRLRLGAFERGRRIGTGRMVVATGDAYTQVVYEIGVRAVNRRAVRFRFRAPGRRAQQTARLRGRKLSLTVPRKLRRALGGPAWLTNFRLELGGNRRTVALRRCKRPYAYAVRIRLANRKNFRTAQATDRSGCRR